MTGARIMRMHYRIDDYQRIYVVIDSFDQLLTTTLKTDFAPPYAEVAALPELASDAVEAQARLFQRGTLEQVRAAASS